MVLRLLIDSDPGIDDVMSILLALANPQVDLRAITLTFGNTNLENVSRNIASLFHVVDQQNKVHPFKLHSVPRIAIGSKDPLKGKAANAEQWHGIDGFGKITQNLPQYVDSKWLVDLEGGHSSEPKGFVYSELNAVDEILHQIKSGPPHSLVIVALGPLTNIAKAIQKDPHTMGLIKKIFVMGGAINMPGNSSPVSEFNFFADPYAAHIVINATRGRCSYKISETKNPIPLLVSLVPLNITHTTFMLRENMENHLNSIKHQPLAEFFSSMLSDTFQITLGTDNIDGICLYDPLAVGIALGMVTPNTINIPIHIEHESSLTSGMCVVDYRSHPPRSSTEADTYVEVCMSIPNPDEFQFQLLHSIFPKTIPATLQSHL